MEVSAEVTMTSRGVRRLSSRFVKMLPESPGIWKVVINLKQELSAGKFGLEFCSCMSYINWKEKGNLFSSPIRKKHFQEN
jgi:hypothetical protein